MLSSDLHYSLEYADWLLRDHPAGLEDSAIGLKELVLVKYLAVGVFAAVDTAFNSTLAAPVAQLRLFKLLFWLMKKLYMSTSLFICHHTAHNTARLD